MLGTKVKDKVTGFQGIVTGVTHYLTGCSQALVVPPVDEQGNHKEGHWYDFQRLDRVDESLIVLDNSETPGCDMPAPKR